MSGRFLAMIFGLVLLVAVIGRTDDLRCETKPKGDMGDPIQIVSDRLDAYNDKRMIVFTGNAVATQKGRTIRADRLTLYYREEKGAVGRKTLNADSAGNLERVEATGHVTITEGERVVTGETAVFDQDAQKITMTGGAVMREGGNIIRGERIVVFLNENRGVVESEENSRVTATIYPSQQPEKKK